MPVMVPEPDCAARERAPERNRSVAMNSDREDDS
jgi:hypothetical protein